MVKLKVFLSSEIWVQLPGQAWDFEGLWPVVPDRAWAMEASWGSAFNPQECCIWGPGGRSVLTGGGTESWNFFELRAGCMYYSQPTLLINVS